MQNYNFFTNMNIYFPEKTEKNTVSGYVVWQLLVILR